MAVSPDSTPADPGQAPIQLNFANGTRLRAMYWRLMVNDKPFMSSFDYKQTYGLHAPIDAIKDLRNFLDQKVVTNASLDRKTGDLVFGFSGGVVLQVLNVTSYEVWEIGFPGWNR